VVVVMYLLPLVSYAPILLAFFLYSYAAHRDLHSFPTRRSSDLPEADLLRDLGELGGDRVGKLLRHHLERGEKPVPRLQRRADQVDRKSTRLNSSHGSISYAVFCLKKKKKNKTTKTQLQRQHMTD